MPPLPQYAFMAWCLLKNTGIRLPLHCNLWNWCKVTTVRARFGVLLALSFSPVAKRGSPSMVRTVGWTADLLHLFSVSLKFAWAFSVEYGIWETPTAPQKLSLLRMTLKQLGPYLRIHSRPGPFVTHSYHLVRTNRTISRLLASQSKQNGPNCHFFRRQWQKTVATTAQNRAAFRCLHLARFLPESTDYSASFAPSRKAMNIIKITSFPVFRLCVVTRLRVGRLRFNSRQGAVKAFFSVTTYRLALGPTQLPMLWVLGVKQPGSEADHSHPSSAEVKNAWSHTSTSLCTSSQRDV
jgi:hypothetical protein